MSDQEALESYHCELEAWTSRTRRHTNALFFITVGGGRRFAHYNVSRFLPYLVPPWQYETAALLNCHAGAAFRTGQDMMQTPTLTKWMDSTTVSESASRIFARLEPKDGKSSDVFYVDGERVYVPLPVPDTRQRKSVDALSHELRKNATDQNKRTRFPVGVWSHGVKHPRADRLFHQTTRAGHLLWIWSATFPHRLRFECHPVDDLLANVLDSCRFGFSKHLAGHCREEFSKDWQHCSWGIICETKIWTRGLAKPAHVYSRCILHLAEITPPEDPAFFGSGTEENNGSATVCMQVGLTNDKATACERVWIVLAAVVFLLAVVLGGRRNQKRLDCRSR
ncbi:unnamed protein product, partial [Amoebophrya sp. A120]|eukprot:GSA120T00024010001.1